MIPRIKSLIANRFPFAYSTIKATKLVLHNSYRTLRRVFRLRTKPRICILADRPNWAYANSARQIKRQLAREFDIDIRYAVKKRCLYPNDYDLLHVCFWGDTHYKAFSFEPERIIKEVSSHRWEDNSRYGPCTPADFVEHYLSDCDTAICTSRRLTTIVGSAFSRTFCTPNGVDTNHFRMKEGHDRRTGLVLGWAGNIKDEVKGLREFIEPASADRFVLITAKGDLKYHNMPDFYRKVDVFVVASRHEGEPLTLLEAMASGCFPVCVDVGIVPELITHKVNGYIVPERSVIAFREAFEWCDIHRERIRAIRSANLELIRRERNWRTCAQSFARVYRETIARSNRPLFRNDDVSWDTNLQNFQRFCATFQRYAQTQLHGITLRGCTNNVYVHNGAAVEYEGFDTIAKLDNTTIRQLSEGKVIEARTDLIEYLNGCPDELAFHGLFHTDYSTMTSEEQERDIVEGLALMHRLFPRKRVRFFIAPFNRTNPETYRIAAKHQLRVLAAGGAHLEHQIHTGNLSIKQKQWHRYHHHRFYPESRVSYYDLSIEKLDAALSSAFNIVGQQTICV